MPDLIDIDLDTDILLPRYALRMRDWVIEVDPNLYTVEIELRAERFFKREAELLKTGEKSTARAELLDLVADILLPTNPGWTRDLIGARLGVRELGWVLRFFESPDAAQRTLTVVRGLRQTTDSPPTSGSEPTPASLPTSPSSTTPTTPAPPDRRPRRR